MEYVDFIYGNLWVKSLNISERDSHKEIKNSGVGIISIFLQILAIIPKFMA